jgi:GNAT superfamily N-acetyltransferase
VAGADDVGALAALRAAWTGNDSTDPDFAAAMARWLESEGDRRTTWIATVNERPVGMASLFEYHRMPKPQRPVSRWGYVSNMFVRAEFRQHGIGSALLTAIIAAAEERHYARLVLSPSPESVELYRRAGFVDPDGAAGTDRLLVRPAGADRSASDKE